MRRFSEDFIEKYISNLAKATTDEERASWQKSLDFQLNQYRDSYGEDYMDVRENRSQAENDKLRKESSEHLQECAENMHNKLNELGVT